ncbi:MAG: hypothetical protein ACKV0T_11905 [Planctomycetales bacterium]
MLLCLFTQHDGLMAADPAADLERIRAGFERHLGQVKSLAGKGRMREINHAWEKSQAATQISSSESELEFLLEIPSGCWKLNRLTTFHLLHISPHRFVRREWMWFDGMYSHILHWTFKESPFDEGGPPPDVPYRLRTTTHDESNLKYVLHDFAGLRLRQDFKGLRLADLLRTNARLDGVETIHGARCSRIVLIRYTGMIIVWLDEDHGFVPRRLQYFYRDLQGKFESLSETLEIPAVSRQSAVGLETPIWLPTRTVATNGGPMETQLDIDELQINEPTSPEQFQFDPNALPEGISYDLGDGRRGYTGDRADLYKERVALVDAQERLMDEAKARNASHRSPPTAMQSATGPANGPAASTIATAAPWPAWVWVVSLLGLLLAGAGWAIVVKRRRRQSPSE